MNYEEAGYIESWSQVPDGAVIIEDTFNEVYEVFTRDGERWIRQIGWQLKRTTKPVPKNKERPLDFEPNCAWDQPWIWLKGVTVADYALQEGKA